MYISRLRVTNFKSFKELDIDLQKYNVVVGANASGKSNFTQVFAFLRDIAQYGLKDAISLQGGVEYLTNIQIGGNEELSVSITIANPSLPRGMMTRESDNKSYRLDFCELIYEFSLKFKKTHKNNFDVEQDRLILKCQFVEAGLQKNGQNAPLVDGSIMITHRPDIISGEQNLPEGISVNLIDFDLKWKQLLPDSSRGTLLLEYPSFEFGELFKNITIYDLDPKLSKKAVAISGRTELEENGSNLTLVLKNILEDKKQRRTLSNLIQDLLPFVRDVRIEKIIDQSLRFTLRETYSEKRFVPASLMSDGTLNILALIVALYFGNRPFIIIEEPERNIHPHLIGRVVNMIVETSERKQILITTHNPELIKHTDINHILLVSRDSEGFSVITRPSEKEDVKIFLANELGIEDLFVQNLLGA
jgi:predicted ATPase